MRTNLAAAFCLLLLCLTPVEAAEATQTGGARIILGKLQGVAATSTLRRELSHALCPPLRCLQSPELSRTTSLAWGKVRGMDVQAVIRGEMRTVKRRDYLSLWA